MVENVEKLRAELKAQPVAQGEVLAHGKIIVPEARAKNLVAAQVAEGAIGGLCKGQGIQVAGCGRPVGENRIDAWHNIRPLVKIEGPAGVIRGDDADWPTRLHGDDGIQLPAET